MRTLWLVLLVGCFLSVGVATSVAAVATPSPTKESLLSRYAIVLVVNDLPGSHLVSNGWASRRLDRTGDRAVFFFTPGIYVMLNLDRTPNRYYHVGYTQPGIKVIYTSWFQFAPL
jgi:hypothetical protein